MHVFDSEGQRITGSAESKILARPSLR